MDCLTYSLSLATRLGLISLPPPPKVLFQLHQFDSMTEPYTNIQTLLAKPALSDEELSAFEIETRQWSDDDLQGLIESGIIGLCSNHVNDDSRHSPQWDVVYILFGVLGRSEQARTLARAELVPRLSNALLEGMKQVRVDQIEKNLKKKCGVLAALCFAGESSQESSHLDWVQQLVIWCKETLEEAVTKGTAAKSRVVLQVILGLDGSCNKTWNDARLMSHIAKHLLQSGIVALLHTLCKCPTTSSVASARKDLARDALVLMHVVFGYHSGAYLEKVGGAKSLAEILVFVAHKCNRDMQKLAIVFLSDLVYTNCCLEPSFFSEPKSMAMLHHVLAQKFRLLELEALAFVSMLPSKIFAKFANDFKQFSLSSIIHTSAKDRLAKLKQCTVWYIPVKLSDDAKVALQKSGLLSGIGRMSPADCAARPPCLMDLLPRQTKEDAIRHLGFNPGLKLVEWSEDGATLLPLGGAGNSNSAPLLALGGVDGAPPLPLGGEGNSNSALLLTLGGEDSAPSLPLWGAGTSPGSSPPSPSQDDGNRHGAFPSPWQDDGIKNGATPSPSQDDGNMNSDVPLPVRGEGNSPPLLLLDDGAESGDAANSSAMVEPSEPRHLPPPRHLQATHANRRRRQKVNDVAPVFTAAVQYRTRWRPQDSPSPSAVPAAVVPSAGDAAPAIQATPPPAEPGVQNHDTHGSMNTAKGAQVLLSLHAQHSVDQSQPDVSVDMTAGGEDLVSDLFCDSLQKPRARAADAPIGPSEMPPPETKRPRRSPVDPLAGEDGARPVNNRPATSPINSCPGPLPGAVAKPRLEAGPGDPSPCAGRQQEQQQEEQQQQQHLSIVIRDWNSAAEVTFNVKPTTKWGMVRELYLKHKHMTAKEEVNRDGLPTSYHTRFPVWGASMEGRDVEHFLTAHPPLAVHVKVVKDNGFESLEMLALATESDLEYLGLPLGHRRLLQSKLPEQIKLRDEEAGKAKHLRELVGPDTPDVRFTFKGVPLTYSMTIGGADLKDGDIVIAMFVMRGDIGHFGPHLSSPEAALLSSSSAALGGTKEEVACVVEQVRKESVGGKLRGGAGGHCDSVCTGQQEPQWHAPSQCLSSEQQRLALMRVLDQHWKIQQQQQQQHEEEDRYHEAGASSGDALSASSPVTPFADFKVELSRSELENVVGVESVARLVSLFGGRVDQIKLRRVSAGSHGAGHGGEQDSRLDSCCIPFHLDEAELTMQVALNSPDDYIGGALVFLLPHTASALVPSRCPGSATVHNNSVVHGVTRMQAGVRYSLFLMQLLDMQVGGEGAAAAS